MAYLCSGMFVFACKPVSFLFKGFNAPVAFAVRIAELADREGHHPDLHLAYGKCSIELWTHAIRGLSENDFILAAKIDTLPLPAKKKQRKDFFGAIKGMGRFTKEDRVNIK